MTRNDLCAFTFALCKQADRAKMHLPVPSLIALLQIKGHHAAHTVLTVRSECFRCQHIGVLHQRRGHCDAVGPYEITYGIAEQARVAEQQAHCVIVLKVSSVALTTFVDYLPDASVIRC